MTPALHSLLIAVAANEEFVPADDWRGAIALPLAIFIFFGAIFLLLKANLGTRRAYLLEATCFFGFMLILSLFWAFGAPGTPRNTGPQTLPGKAADYYTPKWVAFAGDSTLADERFPLVKQFPEGFEEAAGAGAEAVAAGGDEAAADAQPADTQQADTETVAADPAGGAEEIATFFGTERGGAAPIGADWVLDGAPFVTTTDAGEEVVGATYAKPFALNDEDEVPQDEDGQPLFEEDQAGQPIPEDFQVPAGVEDSVAQALTPERFTAFAFYDPGFAFFPALVMILLSVAGFILHALLLGWDENREKERTVEEVVIEREPVSASR